MKSKYYGLLIALMLPVMAMAQAPNGLGLKLGTYNAISYKRLIGSRNAFDISLGGSWYGYRDYKDYVVDNVVILSGMYEWRTQLAANDLELYYGVGGQLISRTYSRYRNEYRDGSRAAIGAVGTLGLDYYIPRTPISLLLELDPYVELAPYPLAIMLQLELGARVHF